MWTRLQYGRDFEIIKFVFFKTMINMMMALVEKNEQQVI